MTDSSTKTSIMLIRELEQMAEHKAVQRANSFAGILNIFGGNYLDLLRAVELHNSPEALALLDIKNRDKLEGLQNEVARRLYNYIASGYSLAEHADKLFEREYKPKGQLADYMEQRNQRFKKPVALFMRELRRFLVHFDTAPIATTMRIAAVPPSSSVRIVLPTSIFSTKGFKWAEEATAFSGGLNEVDIQSASIAFHDDVVTSFVGWFGSQLANVHKDDLEAVNAKKAAARAAHLKRAEEILETDLNVYEQLPTSPENLFLSGSLLTREEWESIALKTDDGGQRAEEAFQLLKEMGVHISGDLKSRVAEVFKNYQARR